MKRIILFIILVISYTANFTLAQLQYFFEDFDQYISGQQLACQNPIDWTTWSYLPCSNEDPNISTNYSFSGTRSVKISPTNDLIKQLGNYSTGRNHIFFRAYLPNGKSGEFSLLSKFNPDPNELAFECYFDVGGIGRLISIPGEPVLFNYTYNQWHLVWVVVDFYWDEAQFYFDDNLIHIWNWTQNGTITNQLAAQNFYGRTASNELYIDDYYLMDNNCLSCYTPTEPRNLTAQQVFYTEPKVQLNWQPSLYWGPRAYEIIRKIGYPSNSKDFETLAYVLFSELQYIDSNIVIDSTYTYGVIAMNMYGYSDTSNFATITVDPVTTLNEENWLTSYSLDQNYPNPFNPVTSLQYAIGSRQFITLKVYDVLGNEVATLVNEEKPPGVYEVKFTVGQDSSPDISSGIYFYQMKAGSFIQTKKMVLLR